MSPEAILTGHVESVVCVSISASLALVVSGARRKPRNLSVYFYMFVCLFVCLLLVDGNCLVHNTSGELLHKLVSAYNWLFPHLIAMTTRGHIVVHYADQKGCIAVFSCNGKQFAQCALGDPALVYIHSLSAYDIQWNLSNQDAIGSD